MTTLERFYHSENQYELCIDEVGRGCLYGRTYIACVVLPRDPDLFDATDVKDSKKFSSKKKIRDVAARIREQALFWHIEYIEHDVIDKINILQAVMKGMHACIHTVSSKIKQTQEPNKTHANKFMAVIDGNYFTPYLWYDDTKEMICQFPHVTVEKGDARYMGIAAASILAKVARDDYIADLCAKHPQLTTYYGLDTNMGYGTKRHLDGIRNHGLTQWHRTTFGLCKSVETKADLEDVSA